MDFPLGYLLTITCLMNGQVSSGTSTSPPSSTQPTTSKVTTGSIHFLTTTEAVTTAAATPQAIYTQYPSETPGELQFDLPRYISSVPENYPLNTPIPLLIYLNLKTTGENWAVRISNTSMIDVYPSGGNSSSVITLLITDRQLLNLDRRNAQDKLEFRLYASTANYTTYTAVELNIQKVNDHPPMFKRRSEVIEVSESNTAGNTIYTAEFTDVDKDDARHDFKLVPPSSSFRLDRPSGRLTLKKALDYEEQSEYCLVLNVSDGTHFDLMSLVIKVINENDNPPLLIQSSLEAVVIEESTDLLPQVVIEARDADDPGKVTQLQYSVLPGRQYSTSDFHIDNRGRFTINKTFNLPKGEQQRMIPVSFEVNDGVFSERGVIIVHIIKDPADCGSENKRCPDSLSKMATLGLFLGITMPLVILCGLLIFFLCRKRSVFSNQQPTYMESHRLKARYDVARYDYMGPPEPPPRSSTASTVREDSMEIPQMKKNSTGSFFINPDPSPNTAQRSGAYEPVTVNQATRHFSQDTPSGYEPVQINQPTLHTLKPFTGNRPVQIENVVDDIPSMSLKHPQILEPQSMGGYEAVTVNRPTINPDTRSERQLSNKREVNNSEPNIAHTANETIDSIPHKELEAVQQPVVNVNLDLHRMASSEQQNKENKASDSINDQLALMDDKSPSLDNSETEGGRRNEAFEIELAPPKFGSKKKRAITEKLKSKRNANKKKLNDPLKTQSFSEDSSNTEKKQEIQNIRSTEMRPRSGTYNTASEKDDIGDEEGTSKFRPRSGTYEINRDDSEDKTVKVESKLRHDTFTKDSDDEHISTEDFDKDSLSSAGFSTA